MAGRQAVLMYKISEICDGCGECASSCPLDIIRQEDGKFIIGIGCNLCGICASVCPRGAISKK
jgi:ferredoxin